jgi:chemotaxis protein MotB
LRQEITALEARVADLVAEKETEEREKREKLDEISRTYEGLLEGMKEEVAKGRVTISQLRGKLTVNLLDEILFDSGSAAIKPEGRDVLKRLGGVLAEVGDKAVVIEGHTDNVPISGELAKRFPTNWELSTARATSVVRYLEEEAGILPERLSAMGFGPHRPVASNDSPEGRLRNRRIEIKLVPLEAPLFAPTREAVEEGSTEPAEGSGQE